VLNGNIILSIINFQKHNQIIFHFFSPSRLCIYYMSSYGPHFVDPVFKKDKQIALQETGEITKLTHIPIKAARNNDSSSIFHDDVLSKFTNYVMKGGNKLVARNLLDKCFENIKRSQLERYHLADANEKAKIETNPMKILHQAIENCRPLLQLTPIKRGGVKYQVTKMFLSVKA